MPLDNGEMTWYEKVLDAYSKGAADVEVCKIMKTTQAKFNQLYENDANFKEIVDYGRTVAHAWWLTTAREAIFNRTFNTSMWYATMKNRYGWSDKSEVMNTLPDELASLDALRAKLAEKLPEIYKLTNPDATAAQVVTALKTVK